MNVKLQRGFTLLEILLVVALLGVVSAVVVAALPNDNNSNPTYQSETLAEAIQLAADRAIVEGRVMGVKIEPQHWQVMELYSDSKIQSQGNLLATHYASFPLRWRPWKYRKIVLQRTLPNELSLQLTLQGITPEMPEDSTVIDKDSIPQIWLMPGGDITPFEITLNEYRSSSNQIDAFTIQGDIMGRIKLLRPDDNEG